MLVNSTVFPEPIWLGESVNGSRKIALRRNIFETNVEDDLIYQYEEVGIQLIDREDDNLLNYISNYFNILFENGLLNESPIPEPIIEDYLLDMDFRLSMIELGV